MLPTLAAAVLETKHNKAADPLEQLGAFAACNEQVMRVGLTVPAQSNSQVLAITGNSSIRAVLSDVDDRRKPLHIRLVRDGALC